MTPAHIDAIIDHHIAGWVGSGQASDSNKTLRIRIADMIREALKLRDKQWEDGQMTLKHELQQAQDTIDLLRGVHRT